MMIILISIIIIAIITFYILYNYIKIKDVLDTIEICENNLYDTLDSKANKLRELKINLDEIDSDNLINYDEVLYNKYKSYKNDKKLSKKTAAIIKNIKQTDEEIDGLKDYYNMNANKYNYLYYKKPIVLFYKLLKLDKIDTFKIRKDSDLKILKD